MVHQIWEDLMEEEIWEALMEVEIWEVEAGSKNLMKDVIYL
jgi:hypothetical protein